MRILNSVHKLIKLNLQHWQFIKQIFSFYYYHSYSKPQCHSHSVGNYQPVIDFSRFLLLGLRLGNSMVINWIEILLKGRTAYTVLILHEVKAIISQIDKASHVLSGNPTSLQA